MDQPTKIVIDAESVVYVPTHKRMHSSFVLSMTPKEDQPWVFDAKTPYICGELTGQERQLTVLKFSNVADAITYVKGGAATKFAEFKGFLVFSNKGGTEGYVLGEWVGLSVKKWAEWTISNEAPSEKELWEQEGQTHRQASKYLKAVGKKIVKMFFKRHEKEEYVGSLDNIYINPLTSTVTAISILNTGLSADMGVVRDLDVLLEFVFLCNNNDYIPPRMHPLKAVDWNMFIDLWHFLSSSRLQMKEKSYIACHAPFFWTRCEERYNFANMFWERGKLHWRFYSYVTFEGKATEIGEWMAKVKHSDILNEIFEGSRSQYQKHHIMDFHRNSFSHFSSESFVETRDYVDKTLVSLFPDAYPKAYLELFMKWHPYEPHLIDDLKFGDYPLYYGDNNN